MNKKLISKIKRWRARLRKIKPQDLFSLIMVRSENYWLGVVALIVIITRWIGRSEYLYASDSALYALALDRYDVSVQQPHPPGYALYILFAKGFYWLTGDANTALVIVSIIFSVLAVYAVFYLAKLIYGKRVAWLSVVLLVTGPLFWFHGQVALNYVCDAFFAAWAGLYLYRAAGAPQNRRALYSASLILTIGGGFRPTLLLFMLPVWLWVIWRQRSWRGLLINISIVLGGTLVWLLPVIWLSGGPLKFWQALFGLLGGKSGIYAFSVFNEGLAKLVWYGRLIWNNLLLNFGLASLLTVAYLTSWLVPRTGERKINGLNFWFWGLWLAPTLLFYLLVIFNMPGYLLILLPALTILVAKAIEGLAEALLAAYKIQSGKRLLTTQLLIVSAITIAGFNVFNYVKPDTIIELQKSTHYAINRANILWPTLISTIKQNFNPQSAIIGVDAPFVSLGLPQFEYYFPEYPVYSYLYWGMYNPDNKKWLMAYRHQLHLVDELEITPNNAQMIIIRGTLALPLAGYSQVTLGEIGYLAYYDLTKKETREVVSKLKDVKVTGIIPPQED